MNELSVFNYTGRQVRTLNIDGEPWFVAKDVCDVLEIGNSRMALDRLDDDEKGVSSIDTLGGPQEMQTINEPGLYTLILGSRKKEARDFKRWVTHEVIPTIRKTGTYTAKPLTQAELIAAQAQCVVELEKRVDKVDTKLANALDALAAPDTDDWRNDVNLRIRQLCMRNGFSYLVFWGDLYKELESSAHVNLTSRQTFLKRRLKKGGAKHKEYAHVSKLDVINRDPHLKMIFDGIVRKHQARFATGEGM